MSSVFHRYLMMDKLNRSWKIAKPLCYRFVSTSAINENETTNSYENKAASNINSSFEEDQFRIVELTRKKFERRPRTALNEKFFKPPREKSQPVNQDWGNVWPSARSFHPASVPLPVRMGFPHKTKPSPVKWGNAELMKIPNFLHLTPPVIERQCEAIKKFCTPWPKQLELDEKQKSHFPVTATYSSYLHSSPTIRDPRSRIVSIKVSLESLDLDAHALDKMLRLVGDRFDPATNVLTLTADRCPLKTQNLQYCFYLLTVLYNESLKTEPWEHEKEETDVEYYTWEGSSSEKVVKELEAAFGASYNSEDLKDYADSVSKIHNIGEDEKSLSHYKSAVLKLLDLS